MSSYSDILDYWLGRCYAADHLLEGKFQEIFPLFKDKLAKGTALEKAANERVAQLDKIKDRCYISKKHLYYLQMGLSQ